MTALTLSTALTLPAYAEEQHHGPDAKGPARSRSPGLFPETSSGRRSRHLPERGRGPPRAPGGWQHQGGGRMAHGGPPARVYGGHPYRGRVAWEGGRWRHEVHDGRDGWWWDVGGVWYYYPQQIEGPPAYISEDFVEDVGYPPGRPSPRRYAPATRRLCAAPATSAGPGASAVGGAIVGGLIGGLLTGQASGAAAGAIAGGATGAIAGRHAAARPGYYFAQGNCYYRYPSGQYVQADPRACYEP